MVTDWTKKEFPIGYPWSANSPKVIANHELVNKLSMNSCRLFIHSLTHSLTHTLICSFTHIIGCSSGYHFSIRWVEPEFLIDDKCSGWKSFGSILFFRTCVIWKSRRALVLDHKYIRMAKRAPGGARKKDTRKSSALFGGYEFYCWATPLLSIILCKWKELCSIVNRSVKVGNHQTNEIRGQCGEWDEDWEKVNFTVEFKIWSPRPLVLIITIINSLDKVSDCRERGRAWWKLVTTLPE